MEKIFRFFCALIAIIVLFSSTFAVYGAIFEDKPKYDSLLGCGEIIDSIKNANLNLTSEIFVKDKDGNFVSYCRLHGAENRIWVNYDKMPKFLIDAFVSIEDQRFFSHKGVDWKRTSSAFLNYLPFLELYSGNQGGSTVTQQLIKNITMDNEESAKRKVREITRAMIIESKLDKRTILEAYLNTISLGNGICGVQVAANYYFNKDVSNLSLAECASLAGITKNPSAYAPDTHPENNRQRRNTVLEKMYELGKISVGEYNKAINTEITTDKTLKGKFEKPINNYFVDTLISNVTENLIKKYGYSKNKAFTLLYNGGLKIYASLDTDIQNTVESVYENTDKYFNLRSPKDKSTLQSAITVTDYEGHIKAICGGTGKKTVNRGLNRAYDSPRQPGSTMKPLGAYTLAIEKGLISFSSFKQDKPLKNYYARGKSGPKEWYGYYSGKMSVQKAIERSANTVPCHLINDIGTDETFDYLTKKLNFSYLTDEDKNLSSLALGGCKYGITTTQSAAAYSIFGNGGKYYNPITYYKVENSKGKIILQDGEYEQIIQPASADIMNRLLQNVVYGSSGTGRGISWYSKMKAYAKTGTSSESNDLWMVAGTPYYVCSVWCGFDIPAKVKNSGVSANVWRTVMKEVHKNLPVKEFALNNGCVEKKYCKITGLLASKGCYSTATGYYLPDDKTGYCSGKHRSSNNKKTESKKETVSSKNASGNSSQNSANDISTPKVDNLTQTSDSVNSSSETSKNEQNH